MPGKRWICDNCKKKDKYAEIPIQDREICKTCKLYLCYNCHTTLRTINMYVSFTREKHQECGKQINLV